MCNGIALPTFSTEKLLVIAKKDNNKAEIYDNT